MDAPISKFDAFPTTPLLHFTDWIPLERPDVSDKLDSVAFICFLPKEGYRIRYKNVDLEERQIKNLDYTMNGIEIPCEPRPIPWDKIDLRLRRDPDKPRKRKREDVTLSFRWGRTFLTKKQFTFGTRTVGSDQYHLIQTGNTPLLFYTPKPIGPWKAPLDRTFMFTMQNRYRAHVLEPNSNYALTNITYILVTYHMSLFAVDICAPHVAEDLKKHYKLSFKDPFSHPIRSVADDRPTTKRINVSRDVYTAPLQSVMPLDAVVKWSKKRPPSELRQYKIPKKSNSDNSLQTMSAPINMPRKISQPINMPRKISPPRKMLPPWMPPPKKMLPPWMPPPKKMSPPGMSTEMTEITPGISTEMSPGTSTEISPGMSTEITPGMSTEITPAMSTEISPGTSTEITPGISTETSTGISMEISTGMSSEISTGMSKPETCTQSEIPFVPLSGIPRLFEIPDPISPIPEKPKSTELYLPEMPQNAAQESNFNPHHVSSDYLDIEHIILDPLDELSEYKNIPYDVSLDPNGLVRVVPSSAFSQSDVLAPRSISPSSEIENYIQLLANTPDDILANSMKETIPEIMKISDNLSFCTEIKI